MLQHVAASVAKSYNVLIIGGAYAGMAAVIKLLESADGKSSGGGVGAGGLKKPLHITLLDSRDGFYHTIGSPLVFADPAFTPKAWRRFAGIKELQRDDVEFVHGRATRIDCAEKTAVYTRGEADEQVVISYDYLVVAAGLKRRWPVVPVAATKEKYVASVTGFIDELKRARDSVVVVGGGAVGIEVAAELKVVHPSLDIILVHSRAELLSNEDLSAEFKQKALELLRATGVEVILNQRIADDKTVRIKSESNEQEDEGYEITLANGRTIRASKIINGVSGSVPSTDFLPRDVVDKEGYVKVLPSLQFPPTVPNSTHHFSVGDLSAVSGIKRGGAAMAMGQQAASSIISLIRAAESEDEGEKTSPELAQWPEVPAMIALAVGKTACSYHPDVGVKEGPEVMVPYFGDDLGWEICWNILKLKETDDPSEF